jgi:hypothetical protein
MTDELDSDFERAQYLQNMLISEATGGGAEDSDYQQLRRLFVNNPDTKALLPNFVRTNRDLAQFWQFIKHKFAHYAERRSFIYSEFTPLLDLLEGRSVVPSDSSISEGLRSFDEDGVHSVWSKAIERRESDPEGAIIGAIFGYFLNKRYDALLASSNAHLNEIQIEIAEIDKNYRKTISETTINEKNQGILESSSITQLNEIKKSISEIEKSYKKSELETQIQKNRIELSLNIADFISEIQPNLEICLQPEAKGDSEKNNFIFTWEITNLGKHTIFFKDISVLLSTKIIVKDEKDNILLKEGEDYELLSRIDIGELPPGQKTYHSWEFIFKHNFRPERIYHYTKFSCQIHKSVKTIANVYLAKLLSKKQINDLTERSFGGHGWLTFNRK